MKNVAFGACFEPFLAGIRFFAARASRNRWDTQSVCNLRLFLTLFICFTDSKGSSQESNQYNLKVVISKYYADAIQVSTNLIIYILLIYLLIYAN